MRVCPACVEWPQTPSLALTNNRGEDPCVHQRQGALVGRRGSSAWQKLLLETPLDSDYTHSHTQPLPVDPATLPFSPDIHKQHLPCPPHHTHSQELMGGGGESKEAKSQHRPESFLCSLRLGGFLFTPHGQLESLSADTERPRRACCHLSRRYRPPAAYPLSLPPEAPPSHSRRPPAPHQFQHTNWRRGLSTGRTQGQQKRGRKPEVTFPRGR